jgi:hypothetical protein
MISDFTVQVDGFSDANSTYNCVVHLQVPQRRLIHPHTVLYEPNPVDRWLVANKPDVWHRQVSSASYLLLSDVLCDQVVCNFFLDVVEVC